MWRAIWATLFILASVHKVVALCFYFADQVVPIECWNGVVTRYMGSGARFSKVPRTFRARKAIRKTTTCLFCKASFLICCKGNRNKNNCEVSCLETPSFWRYKENYVTRNTPEKFRDLRETGPRNQRPKKSLDQGSQLQDLESQCVGSGSAVFFMESGIRLTTKTC